MTEEGNTDSTELIMTYDEETGEEKVLVYDEETREYKAVSKLKVAKEKIKGIEEKLEKLSKEDLDQNQRKELEEVEKELRSTKTEYMEILGIDSKKLEALSEELKEIGENYTKSDEYKEALAKECLDILEEMGDVPLYQVDFQKLKAEAEDRLLRRSLKPFRNLPESKSVDIRQKNLLSPEAQELWMHYQADLSEYETMSDMMIGRHTGTPQCPVCKESHFRIPKNIHVRGVTFGSRDYMRTTKPISCLEHLKREHPHDYEKYYRLEKISKMSISDYIKYYTGTEELSWNDDKKQKGKALIESLGGTKKLNEIIEEQEKETESGKPKTKLSERKR